mmetsp:Transcript_8264/g.10825  ORF Transcript_8264/g.10825 Transcript_8264/m.10825 type:complete len:216 (-) Transcript_8264:275-922(-)|eukprot:CAMPEP_0198150556 /NCGR_PEP_ID=MMETSP1443-20131203/51438_1 /TAXON_ID=186043 /ORGANISM="Entomoneis sp., Strain CCMP2396" /LENGTH=215 /DNA_ID=CAMNT_0043815901 /DNA_START=40 /DNA_END=687 /DNA_ORIENTATION=-
MKFTFPKPGLIDANDWSPFEILEGSIYVLLLTDEFWAIALAVLVIVIQFFVLWNFGFEDWQSNVVTPVCLGNGTATCNAEDLEQKLEPGFQVLMAFILFLHTFGKFLCGVQLVLPMICGRNPWNVQAFIAGMCVSTLSAVTIGIALNFVNKNSNDLVSAVQDVFIIVFILEVDEKALDIIRYSVPDFLKVVLPKQSTTETERSNVPTTEADAKGS